MRRTILAAVAVFTAAAQTQIDLSTQARRVDFSAATATRPIKTGTALPATCAAGEMFFKTDAPGGANVYGCAGTNQWALQSGSLTVASGGAAVGSRATTNYITGPGLLSLISDTGSQIDVTWALDTAVVQTQAGEQRGTARLCMPQSGSGRDYRCVLSPAAPVYTKGMVLHWIPDVSGTGGPTTLNVDTLGAARVKLRDGVSDPTAADILAGQLYAIWYDGAQFRLMMPTASTTPGSVLSVFGRQGAIVPQSGDYTTDEVAEGGRLYFTGERARAAVEWATLAGKPSSFLPAGHAASHRNGGGDEIATAAPAPNAIPKAGSDGKLDPGWLATGGGSLGYTAENAAYKGQANGYAPLDAGAKVPAAHIPDLPYQPALGFIPENAASKGQAGGYASLDGTGKVPASQLPAAAGGGLNAALVFDGSTTVLGDGTTISWTCGSGSGRQCTTPWTAPAGVYWVRVVAWSGGAAGGGSTAGNGVGAGGGGGGYIDRVCAVTPAASYTVAVGLGGAAGGGSTYAAADSGGSSAFGTCFTLLGGVGGGTAPTGQGGYIGGTARFGWQAAGAMRDASFCSGARSSGPHAVRPDGGGCAGGASTTSGDGGYAGGNAVYGGGGGGSGGYNNANWGTGGTSAFGGAGGNGGGWTSGGGYAACTEGAVPGGGGGGAGGAAAGGGNYTGCAGARGEVRVFYAK